MRLSTTHSHFTSIRTTSNEIKLCQIQVHGFQIKLNTRLAPLPGDFTFCETCKKLRNIILQKCRHIRVFPLNLGWLFYMLTISTEMQMFSSILRYLLRCSVLSIDRLLLGECRVGCCSLQGWWHAVGQTAWWVNAERRFWGGVSWVWKLGESQWANITWAVGINLSPRGPHNPTSF